MYLLEQNRQNKQTVLRFLLYVHQMVEMRVVGTGRMKSLVMTFAVSFGVYSAFRYNFRPPMLVKLSGSLRLGKSTNLYLIGNPFFQQAIE